MQENSVALQDMAHAWSGGAPPARDGSPDGEDRRWRVLTIAGHGVDVLSRHEAGMQQLADLQISPGMLCACQSVVHLLLQDGRSSCALSFLNRPRKCRFYRGSKGRMLSAILATIALSQSERVGRVERPSFKTIQWDQCNSPALLHTERARTTEYVASSG
jgi:hypothetical protein